MAPTFQRPLGVTVLASIGWVGAGGIALGAVRLGSAFLRPLPSDELGPFVILALMGLGMIVALIVILALFAVISASIAYALWKGREIGRMVSLTLLWIGLASFVPGAFSFLFDGELVAGFLQLLLIATPQAGLIFYLTRPGVRAWFAAKEQARAGARTGAKV